MMATMSRCPRSLRPAGVLATCSILGLLLSTVAVLAQQAVPTVATREGTAGTGRTGQPSLTGPLTGDNPHAWPTPNGGANWQTVGQPAQGYPFAPVGQTFSAAGLTSTVPPPPNYVIDRQGNEIYLNPITGVPETYGTTIAQRQGAR